MTEPFPLQNHDALPEGYQYQELVNRWQQPAVIVWGPAGEFVAEGKGLDDAIDNALVKIGLENAAS